MKFSIESGTSIGLVFGEAEPLVPDPRADQSNPRGCYVYAHVDAKGAFFYIGKGKARRAWDRTARHALWHRYVEKHLNNAFSVVILADGLDDETAEGLENQWVAQEGERLVNWVNYGRQQDYAAIERFHALRNANRQKIAAAKALEKAEPEKAVELLLEAIDTIAAYATMKLESGLVGTLLDEERSEIGYSGELEALDRLTLVLCRLKRGEEARKVSEDYFKKYLADEKLSAASAIKKRVAKAK